MEIKGSEDTHQHQTVCKGTSYIPPKGMWLLGLSELVFIYRTTKLRLQWQLPVQAVPALRLLAAKCCSVVCYLRNQPMLTTKYRNHTIQPAQKVNSVLYVTCLCNHTLTHNYWKSTEQSSSKTWYRWNKTRLCALFCVSWIQSFLYLTYLKFILIFHSHLRLRLPNRPISFRIFRMTSERISYLPYACYICRPS